MPHCGDYDWLSRAVRQVRFVYYERPLTEIRIHSGQASATNLRIGRDVREYFETIENNFLAYADDVPRAVAFSICRRWAWNVSRRVAGTLL